MGEGVMMKYLLWFGFNGLFASCVYYGLFEGIEGVKNLFLVLFWFMVVVSFFLMTDSVINERRSEKRVMPAGVDAILDAVFICAFAWLGHFVLAGFLVFHVAMNEASWKAARELPAIPE